MSWSSFLPGKGPKKHIEKADPSKIDFGARSSQNTKASLSKIDYFKDSKFKSHTPSNPKVKQPFVFLSTKERKNRERERVQERERERERERRRSPSPSRPDPKRDRDRRQRRMSSDDDSDQDRDVEMKRGDREDEKPDLGVWQGSLPFIFFMTPGDMTLSGAFELTKGPFSPVSSLPQGFVQASMPPSLLQSWWAQHQGLEAPPLFQKPLESYEPQDYVLDQLYLLFLAFCLKQEEAELRSFPSGQDHWLLDLSWQEGRKVWEEWSSARWTKQVQKILLVPPEESLMDLNVRAFQQCAKTHVPPPLEGVTALNAVSSKGCKDPLTGRDGFIDGLKNLQLSLWGERETQERPWIGQMTMATAWRTLWHTYREIDDLSTFFGHMCQVLQDGGVLFLNTWDPDTLEELWDADHGRVGHSSCCLLRCLTSTKGTPLQKGDPYTLVWENKVHPCVYFSLDDVLHAARLHQFECVTNVNVFDLIEEQGSALLGDSAELSHDYKERLRQRDAEKEKQRREKKKRREEYKEEEEVPLPRIQAQVGRRLFHDWSKNEWMTARMTRFLQFRLHKG